MSFTIFRVKYFKYLLLMLPWVACVNPFAPQLTEDNPNLKLILTEQKTPEEVLTNFSFAYNFKDSLVYSDLLDSTFLFISKDYQTDPVTNLSWGRDIDIKTTLGIFRNVESLNLVWERTGSKIYLESDSSVVQLEKSFQLTLVGGALLGGNETITINGIAKFIFLKKPSGIWKITRWEDEATF